MPAKEKEKISVDKILNTNSLTRYEKIGRLERIYINKFTYTYKNQFRANKDVFFL